MKTKKQQYIGIIDSGIQDIIDYFGKYDFFGESNVCMIEAKADLIRAKRKIEKVIENELKESDEKQ